MRTIERFAFIFGILNLVFGVLAFFSPFVSHQRRGLARFLPHRNRGFINRQPGRLFNLFAVNPTHAAIHSALGAAGLATRPLSHFSRPYLGLSALLFGALAAIGWANTGFRSRAHHLMGAAVDWRDNILHTVLAAGSLLLALRPDLGRSQAIDRGMELTNAGLSD
jgi:hypothetical protein